MTKRDKVTVDDIIGIVHTDEPTDSVEEVRKLRGRKNEKRFTYDNKQVAILKNGEFWLECAISTACNHSEICNELNKLVDENEQLKSTIKEVTELLSDEVDLFSDKATEHDINAYIELKELDNKDAFYMATATKKAIRMLKELQE